METKTKLLIAFAVCLVAAVIVIAYLPQGGQPVYEEPAPVAVKKPAEARPTASSHAVDAPRSSLQRPLASRPEPATSRVAANPPRSMPQRLRGGPALERSTSGAVQMPRSTSHSGAMPHRPQRMVVRPGTGASGSGSSSGPIRTRQRMEQATAERAPAPAAPTLRVETIYDSGIVYANGRLYASETEYRAHIRNATRGNSAQLQDSIRKWRQRKIEEEMRRQLEEDAAKRAKENGQ